MLPPFRNRKNTVEDRGEHINLNCRGFLYANPRKDRHLSISTIQAVATLCDVFINKNAHIYSII